jgi:hypothetical protein
MGSAKRRGITILATVTVGLAIAHGAAAAMPPEEPADPVCEAGVQATVFDDQGVAHVACVLSEAPPPPEGEPTTTVADVDGSGTLPKTGQRMDTALIGLAALATGMVLCKLARREPATKAFRARRLTP